MNYKRILLKLSGEALMGEAAFGIEPGVLSRVAEQVAEVSRTGVQTALVIGGGNFFRGVSSSAREMDRGSADQIGMLATVMNALAMREQLVRLGVEARVMSAFALGGISESFDARRAKRHLEKGRVVLFAAGTGSPFFTTDTAACLRALEIDAEVVLKATKVDGVYSGDPEVDPQAVMFDRLTYDEVLIKGLRVMDATAVALCREHGMPMIVFNLTKAGNIQRVVSGERIGTAVSARRQ